MPVPIMRKGLKMTQGLHDLCRWIRQRVDVQTMVEIGSFAGESTAIFAEHFPRVLAVDPLLPGYDDTDSASRLLARERDKIRAAFSERTRGLPVTLLELTSEEAATIWSAPVQAIYIDGCHKYASVKHDLQLWLPHITRPGVVAGHDFNMPDACLRGVTQAVREVIGEPDAHFGDHSWVKELR